MWSVWGVEHVALAVEFEFEASRTVAALLQVARKRVENMNDPALISGHGDVHDVVPVVSENFSLELFQRGLDLARPRLAAGLDSQDAHLGDVFRS
jgi:hypothetical protein